MDTILSNLNKVTFIFENKQYTYPQDRNNSWDNNFLKIKQWK